SSRRRHTRFKCDWSSDVCSSDLVFKELTVRRNLEVASCKNPGVFANLGFGFSAKAKIDEVLELIGLTEEAGQVAAYLSHGQTQWLEDRKSTRLNSSHT